MADNKYNYVGTPFFEEYIKNINILDSTLQFKNQSKDQPNLTKCIGILSKDYPYSSFIYKINSRTQKRSNPSFSTLAHFLNLP